MRQTDIGSSHCDKARPASGYYQPSSSRPANTEKVEMTASLIKLKTASPENHIYSHALYIFLQIKQAPEAGGCGGGDKGDRGYFSKHFQVGKL